MITNIDTDPETHSKDQADKINQNRAWLNDFNGVLHASDKESSG